MSKQNLSLSIEVPYVTRVEGHGGEVEPVETYRGATVKMELTPKVRLEVGVSDSFVERTVKTVLDAARTGEVGDGKVFVLAVDSVYRIRTGEADELAVTPEPRHGGGMMRAAARGHRFRFHFCPFLFRPCGLGPR